jgi:hypothetical protein
VHIKTTSTQRKRLLHTFRPNKVDTNDNYPAHMTYLKLARTGEKIPTHSTAFESSNRYTLNWTTAFVERVTPRPRRVLTFMKRSLFKLCLHPVNARIVRPNQVLLARNCYLVNAPVSSRLESGFIGPSCVLSDANDIYGPPP